MLSCWQTCGIWLAFIWPVWLNLSAVHFCLCDWSGLVQPILNSVFWDVTPYIVLAIYQSEGKKIQAARTSEKSVSIYQITLAFIPKDSNPVTARCYGREEIPSRSHSIYSDSPSTAVSSVRDLTRPQFVCGSEFLAGCSRQDELTTTQSCVHLSALEINWTWKSALTKIFLPSFVHDARGFVCRKLCALQSERICKTFSFLNCVKNGKKNLLTPYKV